MRDTLTGICGWPESQVEVYANHSIDDGIRHTPATRIYDAEGALLVYYAGHGQLLVNDDLGLAITDTRRDPQLRLSTSLRLSEIRAAIQIPSPKALIDIAQVLATRDMRQAQEVLAHVARLDAGGATPHNT